MTAKAKHSTIRRSMRRVFKKSQKRIVRYSILTANIALLALVVLFVVQNPNTDAVSSHNATINTEVAANPLDQLSSSEIAVHVAKLASMDEEETRTVESQADTEKIMLAVSQQAESKVISKPQIVSTALKTKKDVQTYTVASGDTLASIASKFNVTSDSIRWSNNLSGGTVPVGAKLLVSPISDGIVYVVKQGDTADTVAAKFHASKDTLVQFNDAEKSGLIVGDTIVVPGGSIQAVATVARAATAANYSVGFGRSVVPSFGGNTYPFGQCTWWAANRRAEIGRPIPNMMGNASAWVYAWQLYHFPYGSAPQYGAVVYFRGGNHVGFVERVNADGSFYMSDMNWYGGAEHVEYVNGRRVTFRTIPASDLGQYYFLY